MGLLQQGRVKLDKLRCRRLNNEPLELGIRFFDHFVNSLEILEVLCLAISLVIHVDQGVIHALERLKLFLDALGGFCGYLLRNDTEGTLVQTPMRHTQSRDCFCTLEMSRVEFPCGLIPQGLACILQGLMDLDIFHALEIGHVDVSTDDHRDIRT